MPINSINNISNVSFKGNETKTEEKQEKTPEQIKDGKKKLALALAGVAMAAVAGIAIAARVRKGKGVDNKEAEAVVENGKKAVEEVVDNVEKYNQKLEEKTIRFKNGIGMEKENYIDNSSTFANFQLKFDNVEESSTMFVGPDKKTRNIFKEIDVQEIPELKRTTIHSYSKPESCFKENPTITNIDMIKDSKGNVIQVIKDSYKTDDISKGGTRTITNILRDKTGKVTGHAQDISEIAPKETPKVTEFIDL